MLLLFNSVITKNRMHRFIKNRVIYINNQLIVNGNTVMFYIVMIYAVRFIAKSIGSPPFNERFDYFSNFHDYKSECLSI